MKIVFHIYYRLMKKKNPKTDHSKSFAEGANVCLNLSPFTIRHWKYGFTNVLHIQAEYVPLWFVDCPFNFDCLYIFIVHESAKDSYEHTAISIIHTRFTKITTMKQHFAKQEKKIKTTKTLMKTIKIKKITQKHRHKMRVSMTLCEYFGWKRTKHENANLIIMGFGCCSRLMKFQTQLTRLGL